jgi:ABC-type multidrug transport system ATPase subunit
MLYLQARQIGKRYRYEWVVQHFDYTFEPGQHYALLGHNGSGKSTLIQLLAGYLTPSSGQIQLLAASGEQVLSSHHYKNVSVAAPYLELIEEFSLPEIIKFQKRLRPFKPLHVPSWAEAFEIPARQYRKELRYYSSGMRQRVKVGLALFAETSVVLLDEPTITLDYQGIQWYQQLIRHYLSPDRILIVASNVSQDTITCQRQIQVTDYKPLTTQ